MPLTRRSVLASGTSAMASPLFANPLFAGTVDGIVIGAGAAGIATARDLVARGYTVQVIEAATRAVLAAGRNPEEVAAASVVPDLDEWGRTTSLFTGAYEMAKDPSDFSCADWYSSEDGTDSYCAESFGALIAHSARDVPVDLNMKAQKIRWKGQGARVETEHGTLSAQAVVVTVPTPLPSREARARGGRCGALWGVASGLQAKRPATMIEQPLLVRINPALQRPNGSHQRSLRHKAGRGGAYPYPARLLNSTGTTAASRHLNLATASPRRIAY